MKKVVVLVLGFVMLAGLGYTAENYRKVDDKLAVEKVQTLLLSKIEVEAKIAELTSSISEQTALIVRLTATQNADVAKLQEDFENETGAIAQLIVDLTNELNEYNKYFNKMQEFNIASGY
jgi:Mg2+ and Co2+ transporter CorA